MQPIGSPYYLDAETGDDGNPGTFDCPLKTFESVVSKLQNGDKVYVRSGHYSPEIDVNDIDDVEIRAEENATVYIDGTESLLDFGAAWEEHSIVNGNTIWKINVGVDIRQLFLNGEEQMPARWPNARFDDFSVFNVSQNWGIGSIDRDTVDNVAPYQNGELIDSGEINSLINSGIDPVGAIGIFNVGGFKSWSKKVTGYDNSTGKLSFEKINSGYTEKHHSYFLEGKLELIDVPGEWWFDPVEKSVFYMPSNNYDPNELHIRGKTRVYGIQCTNSKNFVMEGLIFFGNTFQFYNCMNGIANRLTLIYPSNSRRNIGIAGEESNGRYREVTKLERSKYARFENSSILYVDGPALETYGTGYNTVKNNFFYFIDWSATDMYRVVL